eukprot:595535_1
MRTCLVKRVNLLSNNLLRSHNAIYASTNRKFGMFVDHTSENPTDPDHPDYIDPEEIDRLAKELEDKGIPNSAGNYRQQAREFLFLKLRSGRQAKFIGTEVHKFHYGQTGLPDEHDKSAY